MKSVRVVLAMSIAIGVLCLATPAFGQSTFGTILGTVTDPSGAVVPNAVITVTNQGENISREVHSDVQGNYQAENMKAGLYTVSATATGFKDSVLTDVRLDARQTVRADMKLTMGGAAGKGYCGSKCGTHQHRVANHLGQRRQHRGAEPARQLSR